MSFQSNNFGLIRLFASLQVLVLHSVHALGLSSNWIGWLRDFPGVPIFFVVSGFLVSSSFERSSTIASYFEKRAGRIFPALWVCIWLTTGIAIALGYDLVNPAGLLWLVAQMAGVIYTPDALAGFGRGTYNGSLWTIPVELQFYLLLPALYWVAARLLKGRTTLLLAIAFVIFTGLTIASRYLMPQMYEDGGPLWQKLLRYSFVPHVYLFLFGALAQRLAVWTWSTIRGKALWWLLAYIVMIKVAPASALTDTVSLSVLGGTVISAAYTAPELARHLLREQDVSYGLYIYHGLIINLMVTAGMTGSLALLPVVLAASLFAATASWVLVERRFLARLTKLPRSPSAPRSRRNSSEPTTPIKAPAER